MKWLRLFLFLLTLYSVTMHVAAAVPPNDEVLTFWQSVVGPEFEIVVSISVQT